MRLDLETTLTAVKQWCDLEDKLYRRGDKDGARECRSAISRLEDRLEDVCAPLTLSFKRS